MKCIKCNEQFFSPGHTQKKVCHFCEIEAEYGSPVDPIEDRTIDCYDRIMINGSRKYAEGFRLMYGDDIDWD